MRYADGISWVLFMLFGLKCENTPSHHNDIQRHRIRNHMYTHERDENHNFDLQNVNILMQESHLRPRKFIEGVFSQFNPNSINRAQEIPSAYLNVLHSAVR